MTKNHLKFLHVLCALYDGEHFVFESDIRKKWKKCPPQHVLMNYGKGLYFDYNLEPSAPGYIPTVKGLELVSNAKSARRSSALSIATFIISLLTLAATILIPLLQSLLQ